MMMMTMVITTSTTSSTTTTTTTTASIVISDDKWNGYNISTGHILPWCLGMAYCTYNTMQHNIDDDCDNDGGVSVSVKVN